MDAELQRINPEFAAMLRKLRSIHAVTGGADAQTKSERKKLDSFDGMQSHIRVRLNHFEEVRGDVMIFEYRDIGSSLLPSYVKPEMPPQENQKVATTSG